MWLELTARDIKLNKFTEADVVTHESKDEVTLEEAVRRDSGALGGHIRKFRRLYSQCPVFSFEENSGDGWRTCYGMEIRIPDRVLTLAL